MKDDEIISGIETGGVTSERACYHVFYKMDWKGYALAFLIRQGAEPKEAESIVVDAFNSFYQEVRAGSFQGKSSLKTYFIGIARFKWLKYLRDGKSSTFLGGEGTKELNLVEEDPESHLIRKERGREKKNWFDTAWSKLTDDCRKILVLFGEGASMKYIAKRMDIKEQSARNAKYRCQGKLEEFLKENPNWKEFL